MIGFLGGTFDPIHFGHLNLALALKEQAGLEEVWFCPAFINPFKEGKTATSPLDRLHMLQLALADIPEFKIVENEIRRQGVSYTVDTIRELMKTTDQSFRLLLGADQLQTFHRWKEAETLKQLAPPLVGVRTGCQGGIGIPLFDISGTEIRRRLKENLYVGHFIPSKVLAYIKEKGLYGSK